MKTIGRYFTAAAAALAVCNAFAEGFGTLHGKAAADVASAYRSTSSGLLDTRPVASQTLDWNFSLGDFGRLEGFFWTISSLHDKQRAQHRVLFYDFEACVRYGYTIPFAEDVKLSSSLGPYFDLPFGYPRAHMKCWGPYAVQRLDNPWIVPYWKGLWIIEPTRRGRVCLGLEKKFKPAERLSVAPFAETTWMDKRRFDRRYGAEPEKSDLLGGAFAVVFYGVKASWAARENLSVVATAAMCDIINRQARQATERSSLYYAKNDWPVFRLGVEYSF